jgi:3-hydroxyisobutyrate dehydrogenase-like beta-hydroxyacid dehydrogenase
MVIGIVHPGEMGAGVAASLGGAGHQLLWAGEGRSAQTTARAQKAGLQDAGTLASVVARAELIFSICPPHAALDVAHAVAGFEGIYVDANAVSPQTTRAVATIVTDGGGRFVDGGIVGPPPLTAGSTRLYLSGHAAAVVASLFSGTLLDARVVSSNVGAASALKMAYAGWTKGRAALLLSVRELAVREGVEPALLEEWELSQPQAPAAWEAALRSARAKGWRWTGEMEQIAESFSAAGLPEGFHRAAAEVYASYPRPQGS